jgi:hypothetical protein
MLKATIGNFSKPAIHKVYCKVGLLFAVPNQLVTGISFLNRFLLKPDDGNEKSRNL